MQFPSNEYALIGRIKNILPPRNDSPFLVSIGDDAAVRVNNTIGEKIIVTADVAVQDVHFTLDTMTFEEIGYKCMIANLSDCAAMGGAPDAAIVQIVFPKNIAKENIDRAIEEIYKGFAKLCGKYNFQIVGGDLSGGNAWTIAITLLGKILPNKRTLLRTGIVKGDVLWVTGTPGESAAGLACLQHFGRENVPQKYMRFVGAHISPTARLDEGKMFAECEFAHAAMDLSDGLSKDVATLCYDNNLGFIFERELLPPPEMKELASELNVDWREWFYHGGEEYELLVACASPYVLQNCLRLGEFTPRVKGVNIYDDSGALVSLAQQSWDHC